MTNEPGRIDVLSLLNPETENTQTAWYKQQAREYYLQATSSTVSDNKGYELALWRQESGLGPPTTQAYFPVPPNHLPPLQSYYPRNQVPNKSLSMKHTSMFNRPAGPQIYVPVQPMLPHSAIARDGSQSYIGHSRPYDEDSHGDDASILASEALPQHGSIYCSVPESSRMMYTTCAPLPSNQESATAVGYGKHSRHDDDEEEEDEEEEEEKGELVENDNVVRCPATSSPKTSSPAASSPAASSPATATAPVSVCLSGSRRPSKRLVRSQSEASSSSSSSSSSSNAASNSNSAASDTSATSAVAATSSASADALPPPEVDWRALQVPEEIWLLATELYEQIKTLRTVQNRQPRRMKPAILAAIMFILCRSHQHPRTFTEICQAASVTKREIGMYYKLMKKVLPNQHVQNERPAQPEAFVHRWCTSMQLPEWIPVAATRVYERADRLGAVQGKSPVSVCAASIWLVVWCYNHRAGLGALGWSVPPATAVSSNAVPGVPGLERVSDAIECEQRVICRTASVVVATLTSVLKLLLPHLNALVGDLFPPPPSTPAL